MKRVLVTGAAGFVGRQCLPILLARDYEVHAVSRKGRGPGVPGVVWHKADLLAGGGINLIAAVRPTHLLHLAWDVRPGLFWTSPENLAWVESSFGLVDAFARHGGQRQ